MGITRVLKLELIILAVIVATLALVGLGRTLASSASQESELSYEIIDADLQPFRESFNAASEHLRAVLLVGPT